MIVVLAFLLAWGALAFVAGLLFGRMTRLPEGAPADGPETALASVG